MVTNFFEKDKNYIYEIAQWFPRVVAYTDYASWQHEPYVGHGEFTLEFGNYLVRITAPADMIVAATGELQNPDEVLTVTQRSRLAEAAKSDQPIYHRHGPTKQSRRSPDEDRKGNETTKTWEFLRRSTSATLRLLASRKFICMQSVIR